MLEKIVDWLYLKYGTRVPKRDIVLFLIIIVGIVVLLVSVMVNGGVGKATPGSSPTINNQQGL